MNFLLAAKHFPCTPHIYTQSDSSCQDSKDTLSLVLQTHQAWVQLILMGEGKGWDTEIFTVRNT